MINKTVDFRFVDKTLRGVIVDKVTGIFNIDTVFVVDYYMILVPDNDVFMILPHDIIKLYN